MKTCLWCQLTLACLLLICKTTFSTKLPLIDSLSESFERPRRNSKESLAFSGEEILANSDENTSASVGETTPASGNEETPASDDETTPASGDETTPASGDEVTPASDDETTPASGDETTPVSGDEVTPASDDQTTPTSGDETTPASDDETTPASGDETTPASGDETTLASGDEVTPASDDETTPASGDEVTPASDDQTTPTSGDETTPASDDETTPASGDETTPASDDETTPASDDETTLASGDETTPASGDETTLASGDEVTPASDDETTPASDDETTPASGDETTPASDDETTPASDDETTPASDDETTPASDDETTPASSDEITPASSDETTPTSNSGETTTEHGVGPYAAYNERRTKVDMSRYRFVARDYDYPYHAALIMERGTNDTVIICQGAILNTEWIITSANCYKNYSQFTDNIHLTVGTVHAKGPNAVNRIISQAVNHPKFEPLNGANDLTLLKLNEPLELEKKFLASIALSEFEFPPGTVCNYSSYEALRLYGYNLKLLDPTMCDGSPALINQVYSYQCAGIGDLQFKTNYNEESAFTHVGTPLVCGHQLYGIKTRDGFFTTTNEIKPWVDSVIKNN